MKVLSLFDGIGCARVALERARIDVEVYYSSEIETSARTIGKKNYPSIVELGDVRNLTSLSTPIDLLIGGSPCTDLSIAKRGREGLKGQQSSLFWEYVRVLRLFQPRWFVLENVASMREEEKQTITEALGVEPVLLNASLVSAQRRQRLFWTNLVVPPIEDRKIVLKDILEKEVPLSLYTTLPFTETAQTGRNETKKLGYVGKNDHQGKRVYSIEGKLPALNVVATSLIRDSKGIRRLTPIECERLMSLPDNYTEGVSKSNRYKCLGNAFNVEIVVHILSSLRPNE